MGDALGEVAPVIVDTGVPLAPVAMATERLEELRRRERAFARAVDDEGIAL